MRFAACVLLLTLAAGVAEACSAFIPFDEYAGPPIGIANDAGLDGSIVDDGGAPDAAACKQADLRTDPNNCGACGRVCEGCSASLCPTVTVHDGTTAVTALDLGVRETDGGGEAVYFVRASGTLARIDPDGSRYEESLATAAGAPLGFGTSNGIVASKADGIELFSRDRFVDGGVLQVVPPRRALGPLLYASKVFWSDGDGMFWASPKADAGVTQLSDAGAVAITSAGGVSYWTNENGVVLRTSIQSPDSLLQVLDATIPGTTGIAVSSGRHIYLTQRGQGLHVYDYDNTTAKVVRLDTIDDPELVIVDDTHVYVYDAGPAAGHRRLLRYELDGTGLLTLANNLTNVRGLATDATYLYFTDQTKLQRIAK